MSDEDYNDTDALRQYASINMKRLATELEWRTFTLAIKRDKAAAMDSTRDRLPIWIAREPAEAVDKSLAGIDAVRETIIDRIVRDCQNGNIEPNRCPKCNGVARTPMAEQCLWCGHCWHGQTKLDSLANHPPTDT